MEERLLREKAMCRGRGERRESATGKGHMCRGRGERRREREKAMCRGRGEDKTMCGRNNLGGLKAKRGEDDTSDREL